MKHASLDEAEFVKTAAKAFNEHPEYDSFGDLEEGSYLALRWGLDDDSVLLLKLADDFSPTIYDQVIKTESDRLRAQKNES